MVALAPGDGLLCEKVSYDKFNHMPTTQHPIMLQLTLQQKEVDTFREVIVSYICKREI